MEQTFRGQKYNNFWDGETFCTKKVKKVKNGFPVKRKRFCEMRSARLRLWW